MLRFVKLFLFRECTNQNISCSVLIKIYLACTWVLHAQWSIMVLPGFYLLFVEFMIMVFIWTNKWNVLDHHPLRHVYTVKKFGEVESSCTFIFGTWFGQWRKDGYLHFHISYLVHGLAYISWKDNLEYIFFVVEWTIRNLISDVHVMY